VAILKCVIGASVFSCGTATLPHDAQLTKRLFTAVGLCEVPSIYSIFYCGVWLIFNFLMFLRKFQKY